jgi:hypothetical protein
MDFKELLTRLRIEQPHRPNPRARGLTAATTFDIVNVLVV